MAGAEPDAAVPTGGSQLGSGAHAAPYLVFISHSSSDAPLAQALAEKVNGSGAKAWLAIKDLDGGSPILPTIREAVNKCREAIVLVTPESVRSQWVLVEIGIIVGQGKRVTPLLNHVGHDAIEPIRDVKAVDLNRGELADFLEQLAARVRDLAVAGKE